MRGAIKLTQGEYNNILFAYDISICVKDGRFPFGV
jgi:hypothetical protein